MRKIRDFNLRIPFKETRRRARRVADLDAIGLDDAGFARLLEAVNAKLRPAVLFDSRGPDSEETAAFSPVPGLAHTLGLASLGPDVGPLLDEARTESAERGKVVETVLETARERAVQFVIALLKDEVEAERCELSPIHYLEDASALEAAVARLEGAKIGVAVEAGRLSPPFSAAFCLSWIAQKGRRGSGSKKK